VRFIQNGLWSGQHSIFGNLDFQELLQKIAL